MGEREKEKERDKGRWSNLLSQTNMEAKRVTTMTRTKARKTRPER